MKDIPQKRLVLTTHGLQQKKGDAVLKIRGYLMDNTIFIEITDNGMGFAPVKLREVQQVLDATDFGNFPEPGLSGVALYNVHRRISLRFGDEYGLTIKSVPGEGTTITIKLPAAVDINS